MAFKHELEVISCVMNNDTLVQKSHIENFTTQSQLIVNESQEALFYKEGQALDLFLSGRHALSTENLPLFKRFFSHLLGGNKPFPCQVYFINKVSVLDVLWGTPSPISLEDPQYKVDVKVRASGQTGLRVKDSRTFVVKVVGQQAELSVEELRRSIKGIMMNSLTTLIAKTMVEEKVGILEIATKLESLSQAVQVRLNEKLADIGLEIVHFNIGTIFADDADLAKVRAAKEIVATKRFEVEAKRLEAMADAELEAYKVEMMGKARATARAAEGYTYQDERKFDVLSTAAGNSGGLGGTFINAGVGLGMGLGVMGEIRNQTNAAISQGLAPTKLCPHCNGQVAADAKFCPTCGQSTAPAGKICPQCNAQVAADAKFCPACGCSMAPAGKTCPQCNAQVAADAKFCPTCGCSMVPAKKICPTCNAEVEGNCRFCPACGYKFE